MLTDIVKVHSKHSRETCLVINGSPIWMTFDLFAIFHKKEKYTSVMNALLQLKPWTA